MIQVPRHIKVHSKSKFKQKRDLRAAENFFIFSIEQTPKERLTFYILILYSNST